MSHVAELGSLAAAFAIKPGIRVRGRGMRLVAALLVVEMPLAVGPGAGGSSEPSLARKLLSEAQASTSVPSTEKCSSDKKRVTLG